MGSLYDSDEDIGSNLGGAAVLGTSTFGVPLRIGEVETQQYNSAITRACVYVSFAFVSVALFMHSERAHTYILYCKPFGGSHRPSCILETNRTSTYLRTSVFFFFNLSICFFLMQKQKESGRAIPPEELGSYMF